MQRFFVRYRNELIVAVVTGGLLLPFINKPFHIDDPVFVRVAEQILVSPFEPYQIDYNWDGTPRSMWELSQHPPLHCYMIAAVGAVTGMQEWTLHLAYIGVAIGCALLMYSIACRFCGEPLLATLLSVIAPAFLVSATNLMADVLMMYFWLLAVWAAVKYVETSQLRMICLVSLSCTAAAMTKYFGVAATPLIVVYLLLQPTTKRWHLIVLALPIAVMTAWGMYSIQAGGFFHPLGAVQHALVTDRAPGASTLFQLTRMVAFVGGTMLWPILLLPISVQIPRAWKVVIFVLAAIAAIMEAAAFGGDPAKLPGQVLVYFLLWCAGGLMLAILCLECRRRPDRDNLFLTIWVVGTLAFAGLINWSINARVVLPCIFPATVLFFRWLEFESAARMWSNWCRVAIVPVLALTFLVALGDYEFARAGKDFAQSYARERIAAGEKVWFVGHWGFQYYMEQERATAVNLSGDSFTPGRCRGLSRVQREESNPADSGATSRSTHRRESLSLPHDVHGLGRRVLLDSVRLSALWIRYAAR